MSTTTDPAGSFSLGAYDAMTGRDAFGLTLAELGAEDERIVACSADCTVSTKVSHFRARFPERHFNYGIAEANMVSAAAGLALAGKIPVVAGFGFLLAMRACEMVRTDICYPRLNVKLVASATGLSMGVGGPTHHCLEDLAIMRSFPNMTIVCPATPRETIKALRASVEFDGPVYMRCERDELSGMVELYDDEKPFELGRAVRVRDGNDLTIIFTGGGVGAMAVAAADKLTSEGISTRVVNMHTVKPLDEAAVREAAEETRRIITVEEHSVIGGLGEAVAGVMAGLGLPARLARVGIPDVFCGIGQSHELMACYGISEARIAEKGKELTAV